MKRPGSRACVFDAYGTLFNHDSAAREQQDALGEKRRRLTEIWRLKQLQYTWLRALIGRHADFRQVTEDALDYALESIGAPPGADKRKLMESYFRLEPYPEVKDTLTRLKAMGLKLAILSNGSPPMLDAAVENAGIADLLDAVLSVEQVGVFKPAPQVYELAVDELGVAAGAIRFVSSNGWDAYAAKAFGFRVAWCNRGGLPAERMPEQPDDEIADLTALPELFGA